MEKYSKDEGIRIYQEFRKYQDAMRTETDPQKNFQASQKAIELMEELEKKFDRKFLNSLLEGKIK